MNATDGGQRQCILVTNNEVSEEERERLGGKFEEAEVARTISQLGFAEGRDLDVPARRNVVRLIEGVSLGAVSAGDAWHLEEGATVSILWDTNRGAEWLSVLQEADDVENLYIVTKEKSAFKKLADELKEMLPPLTRSQEVILPMREGFHENLAYYELGFLDPRADKRQRA